MNYHLVFLVLFVVEPWICNF